MYFVFYCLFLSGQWPPSNLSLKHTFISEPFPIFNWDFNYVLIVLLSSLLLIGNIQDWAYLSVNVIVTTGLKAVPDYPDHSKIPVTLLQLVQKDILQKLQHSCACFRVSFKLSPMNPSIVIVKYARSIREEKNPMNNLVIQCILSFEATDK